MRGSEGISTVQLFLMSLLLVGLLVVAVAAWRWSRVLREVARGLERLGTGRRTRQILLKAWGPVRQLIRVFNAAAPEIQGRIDRLEEDRQQLRVVLGAMAEAVIAVDARRRLLFANTSADALFGLDATSVGRLVPELIRSPQVQNAVEATLRLAHPDAYQDEVAAPRPREPRSAARRGSSRCAARPCRASPRRGRCWSSTTSPTFAGSSGCGRTSSPTPRTSSRPRWPRSRRTPRRCSTGPSHDETVNRRFLERIDEQVDRLNQLILDMLSLARLESGQEFFEHGPLSLVPVLESCLEAHRGRAEAKDLSLTFDAGSLDGETLVLADEEAIRQIFDNLIDNAIKYTPEGGKVRVACSLAADAVSVEVADTGIGIPRDDLPRIFERFYRVDKARSRELGGTGLGLSIVKHLISSIGGQISVTSRARLGLAVHRQDPALPSRPASDCASGSAESEVSSGSGSGSGVCEQRCDRARGSTIVSATPLSHSSRASVRARRSSHFSQSMAAAQPEPAAVMAWR